MNGFKAFLAAAAMSAVLIGCGSSTQTPAPVAAAPKPAPRPAPELLQEAKDFLAADNTARARGSLRLLALNHKGTPEAIEGEKIAAAMDAAEQEKKARAAAERKAAIAKATANLKVEHDEFKGVTFYTHKRKPVLAKYFAIYFGARDNAEPSGLRQLINYYDDDWLFVRSVTIKADDQIFDLGPMDFERDHGSGSIWEWSDVQVKNVAMLKAMLAAKRVVIRYNGDQYHSDFVMPASQLTQLREVLTAYEAMGGKT